MERLDLHREPLKGKEDGMRYYKVGIVLYDCAWLDGFMCVTERGETSDEWDNPYIREREWAYQAWKEGALAGESYNKHFKKEVRVKEGEEIDDRVRH